MPAHIPKGAFVESDVPLRLDAYERHAIVRALAENGNSVARAAAALGQPTNTLYNRMSTIGLRRSELGGRGSRKPLPDYLRLDGPVSFEAYERRALERALAEASGDKRAATKLLGMGQSTLYRRCELLGIGRPPSAPPAATQLSAVTEDD